jgi:Flp pilus assembly protein TadG
MNWRMNPRCWRWLRDTRGVAAVEFALVVPMVIIVYAGGFEIAQAATVNRKLTDTTVQLANVTSQYTTVAHPDVNTIFGASSEIMVPYSTGPLTITLSEVQADSSGSTSAKVIWTQSYTNGTPGACATSGPAVTLPTGLPSPNQYYILVQTTYLYTPTVGSAIVSNIPMQDQVFMIPRESPSIPYPTC